MAQFVLVRSPGKDIEVETIKIHKQYFECGRATQNDLVCSSLLVSRHHCIFVYVDQDMYVMDLGSSNGVFVNGVKIIPKIKTILNEFDVIGMGCSERSNLDKSMFVYQLKKMNEKNRSLQVNQINSSHSQPSISNDLTASNVQCTERHAVKSNARSRGFEDDEDIKPFKIPKIEPEGESSDIEIVELDDDMLDIQILSHTHKNSVVNPNQVPLPHPHIVNLNKKTEQNTKVAKIIPSIRSIESFPPNTVMNSCAKPNENDINKVETNHSSTVSFDTNMEICNRVPPAQNSLESKQSNTNCASVPRTKEESLFSQHDDIIVVDDDDEVDGTLPYNPLYDSVSQNGTCTNESERRWSYADDDDDEIIVISNEEDREDVDAMDMRWRKRLMGRHSPIPLVRDIKTEVDQEEPVDDKIEEEATTEKEVVPEVIPEVPEVERGDLEQLLAMVHDRSLLKSSLTDVDFTEESPTNNMDAETAANELINELTDGTVESSDQPETKVPETKAPETTEKKEKPRIRQSIQIIDAPFMPPKPPKKSSKRSHRDKSKEKSSKDSKISKSSSSSSKDKKSHSSKSTSSSKDGTSDKKSKSSSSSSSSSKHKKDSKHRSSSKSSSSSSSKHKSKKDNEDKTTEKENKSNLEKANEIENQSNNVPGDSAVDEETAKKEAERLKTLISSSSNVRVKVSTKTRGDMLCDAMQVIGRPKSRKDVISSKKTPVSAAPVAPAITIDYSNFLRIKKTPTVTTSSTVQMSSLVESSSPQPDMNSPERCTNGYDSPDRSPQQSSGLRSCLQNPSTVKRFDKTNVVKKVTFHTNISTVKEYQIDEGNSLVKSAGKDARVSRALALKGSLQPLDYNKLTLEDFLVNIFAWRGDWIQTQLKHPANCAPVVKIDKLPSELPLEYNNYKEYYETMQPLLLLENWQVIIREYSNAGTSSSRYPAGSTFNYSFVQDFVTNGQSGSKYSEFKIHILISKEDMRKQMYPAFGELILLENRQTDSDSSTYSCSNFAYITSVQLEHLRPLSQYNLDLRKFVNNPATLVTCTLQSCVLTDRNFQMDEVHRLRRLTYLRSNLRPIQGLQYLPNSPLLWCILRPQADEYRIESVHNILQASNIKSIDKYPLVTGDKLNDKQLEAVIRITHTAVNMETKICLLLGPPGTGKSQVISNLVTQILYGEGRYVANKSLRILVCAPSNAAVDEIVIRLLEIRKAITDHRFKLVRIGRYESMHHDVKNVSIEELTKREVKKSQAEYKQKHQASVKIEKETLQAKMNALLLLSDNSAMKEAYANDYKKLKLKLDNLSRETNEVDPKILSVIRKDCEKNILRKADVIACTLTSCYTGQMEAIFSGKDRIPTCIVDEATQSIEAETLIPLMLGVKTLVLVGDPNQLPATVTSLEAKRRGLDQPLFSRIKNALDVECSNTNNHPVMMLDTQYRMFSSIAYWPNKYFYQGKLQNYPPLSVRSKFPFQPYRILNLNSAQDEGKFSNTNEAEFVSNLVLSMMFFAPKSWTREIKIGIITPYQNQKPVILAKIEERNSQVPDVIRKKFLTEVNTIDSFQGQERDVIIISCVRSSGIGFLSDPQRLCVAMTRAKSSLILCGNFATFQNNDTWNALLLDAKSRGVYINVNSDASPAEIKKHVLDPTIR